MNACSSPSHGSLQARDHAVTTAPVNGGGYQRILIDPTTGDIYGAAEARKDGCAVGAGSVRFSRTLPLIDKPFKNQSLLVTP